ncbi:MAG: hypothetical protein ACMUIP_14665, partial [bacterium]
RLIVNKNTPFAQISITKSGEQLNVLLNAIPLFSHNDIRTEAMTHIPMSQVETGATVLLIAGGVFGTLKEIVRHHPARIDYVELDPSIVSLDSKIDNVLSNPVINTHIGDGRLFIKDAITRNTIQYDCIILDLPDPENIQLNRFYTLEFFQEAKKILSDQGVLFFTLTGAENYLGSNALALNISVYGALKRVFPHILVLPGETNSYLASVTPLSTKVADILKTRHITTRWLGDYQLPTMLNTFRIDQTKELLDHNEQSINTDLSPSAFKHLLNLWIKQSDTSEFLLNMLIILVLFLAIVSCQGDALRFVTMSSGYTGIAMELSLLIIFQLIRGYAYLWISTYVTLFMIGSILGAIVSRRRNYKKPLHKIRNCDIAMIMITLISILTSLFVLQYSKRAIPLGIQYFIIPVEILAIAMAIGYQFVAISTIVKGGETEITGRLYLCDLAGSAGGTLLITLLLLPKFGLIGVLLSVLIIKIISMVMIKAYAIKS